MTITQDAAKVVLFAMSERTSDVPRDTITGPALQDLTGVSLRDINDAMTVLRESRYVDWILYLETADFVFSEAWITSKGRFEADRLKRALEEDDKVWISNEWNLSGSSPNLALSMFKRPRSVALQPAPAGSPYGFRDQDWEYIAERRERSNELVVVMGLQFKSAHYEAEKLTQNVESMFSDAVSEYVRRPGSWPASLVFKTLGAGYGEHLFNEIARDIISSDIAVFDTSDLNPNVMIELGVALTWDVRVLPIREASQPRPPSDISGHTWASYTDSGSRFEDSGHFEKLVQMVGRAISKKARRA
jgi:hypothetical protein